MVDSQFQSKNEKAAYCEVNQELFACAHAHDVIFKTHEKDGHGCAQDPEPPRRRQIKHVEEGQRHQRSAKRGCKQHYTTHRGNGSVVKFPRFSRFVYEVLSLGHHDERWHAKEDQQERQNRGNHQGSHGEVKVVEPGVIPS